MIQWPLQFVYPQNRPQREEFWTLVGRQCKQFANNLIGVPEIQACQFREFWHGLYSPADLLQVEVTRSPRGPSRQMETKQAKLLPSFLPSLEGITLSSPMR